MDTLVWVVAAILALNLLALVWLVTLEFVERRRLDKEIKEVDALWRSMTMPLSALAVSGAQGTLKAKHRAPSVHGLPTPARPAGRASMGLAIAATMVWVVVAAIGPSDPRTITAAEDSVSGGVSAELNAPAGATFTSSPDGKGTMGTDVAPQAPNQAPSGTSIATSDDVTVATVDAQLHSSTAIHLEWAEVNEATGYRVERKKGTTQGFLRIALVDEDQTTYNDKGLDSETTYFYRISALTETGAAPPSVIVSATTPIGPPEATSVTAVATEDTIVLAWTDVANETGYRVERSLDGTSGWIELGTAAQDEIGFTDGGLSPGTSYFYRIIATSDGGESAASNVASATTVPVVIDDTDGGAVAEEPLAATEEPLAATDGALAATDGALAATDGALATPDELLATEAIENTASTQ